MAQFGLMGKMGLTNKRRTNKNNLDMLMRTKHSNLRNRKLGGLLLLLLAGLLSAKVAQAQTNSNKIQIGSNISQYQKDFGIGLHVISPYFMRGAVAIKAGTNMQWFENSNGTKTTWTTYQNIQLGLRWRSKPVTQNIWVYGEGGPFIILPNSDFSSKGSALGGYGLFGFEFKLGPGFGYFIELGGVGTGATADKIADKPIYSNGFFTNVGIRIGF